MHISAKNLSRAFIALFGVLIIGLGITSCTIFESNEEKLPEIFSSIEDGKADVDVLETVHIQAVGGKLDYVTLVNEETGKEVKAELDGNEWYNIEPLAFNNSYKLTAKATKDDKAVIRTQTFATIMPDNYTAPMVYPPDGSVVGVAQPVAVKFDEPIADRKRAQKCIHIETTPKVEGAFFWVSNREVRWRGEHFWEPGTKIDVKVDCYGQDMGNGIFAEANAKSSFTIGERVEGFADDKTHELIIKKNGKTIRTIPIAMGTDRFPTPNGIYYIGDKHEHIVMDSSTFGVPVDSADGYKTDVQWATRMSYSGIFIHAAPWSVWAQGNTNASHGCLNVSTENGKWVYDTLKPGDPVTVTNTKGPTLPGDDGLGDWNIPWSEWKEGNADG